MDPPSHCRWKGAAQIELARCGPLFATLLFYTRSRSPRNLLPVRFSASAEKSPRRKLRPRRIELLGRPWRVIVFKKPDEMRCQVTDLLATLSLSLASEGVAANWLLTPAETPTWDHEAQSHLSELRRLVVPPQPLRTRAGL